MRQRLQKVLAAAGIDSRRSCEELIAAGRVSVNGVRVTEHGSSADPDVDTILLDGKPLPSAEALVYLVLNKPTGVVSTVSDPHAEKTVIDLVKGISARVYPVGRLDEDSAGLLILSNDGDFTLRMTHPRHELPKTYRALVRGKPNAQSLRKLREGVQLEDGMTLPADVVVVEFQPEHRATVLDITLREGRNRQIRRMCLAVDLPVIALTRTKIGTIELTGIPPGGWRKLRPDEIAALIDEAGEPKTVGDTVRGKSGNFAPGATARYGREMTEDGDRRSPGARSDRPRPYGAGSRPGGPRTGGPGARPGGPRPYGAGVPRADGPGGRPGGSRPYGAGPPRPGGPGGRPGAPRPYGAGPPRGDGPGARPGGPRPYGSGAPRSEGGDGRPGAPRPHGAGPPRGDGPAARPGGPRPYGAGVPQPGGPGGRPGGPRSDRPGAPRRPFDNRPPSPDASKFGERRDGPPAPRRPFGERGDSTPPPRRPFGGDRPGTGSGRLANRPQGQWARNESGGENTGERTGNPQEPRRPFADRGGKPRGEAPQQSARPQGPPSRPTPPSAANPEQDRKAALRDEARALSNALRAAGPDDDGPSGGSGPAKGTPKGKPSKPSSPKPRGGAPKK